MHIKNNFYLCHDFCCPPSADSSSLPNGADGHEFRDSETTDEISNDVNWIASHSKFINRRSYYDWTSRAQDATKHNLWQQGGSNQVCPEGFHVPTADEWKLYRDRENSKESLKLPMTNWRDAPYYTPTYVSSYWSSTNARRPGSAEWVEKRPAYVFITSSQYNKYKWDVSNSNYGSHTGSGHAVRCIMDE